MRLPGKWLANLLSNRQLQGVALVLLAATAFGMLPILAKIAYANGTDPLSLLFLRFTIAAGIMASIALLRKAAIPRGRGLVTLLLMGGVFYPGQSICFFTALIFVSAGLVALLMSLYPIFVTILAIALFKEHVTPPKWVALALAMTGTVFTIGPVGGGSPLGVVLSICSAFIYATYIVAGSRSAVNTTPMMSATVIMASASVVFGLIAVVRGLHLPTTITGWSAIMTIALISTVFALVAFLAGLERVGPTSAAMLSLSEPVTAVALGAVVLNEDLQFFRVMGGILIFIAVVIISKFGGSPRYEKNGSDLLPNHRG
ncbi:MAG: DMT family transporter [Deltaproteobacteria bacterium]|nr:DMT family transporter [Deltaproteobacteria bacterium]